MQRTPRLASYKYIIQPFHIVEVTCFSLYQNLKEKELGRTFILLTSNKHLRTEAYASLGPRGNCWRVGLLLLVLFGGISHLWGAHFANRWLNNGNFKLPALVSSQVPFQEFQSNQFCLYCLSLGSCRHKQLCTALHPQ